MSDKHLPPFDEMVEMAKNDPEKLEAIKREMIEDIIESAPEHMRDRLRGIQTRMNLISQASSNPLDTTVKMYTEMMKSFNDLNDNLQILTEEKEEKNENPFSIVKKDKD